MSFVEVYVCAVPDENRDAYFEMARKSAEVNVAYGARQAIYSWAAEIPDGEVTSFTKAVQCKEGESVSIGWHVWDSKEDRDAAQPKVMEAMKERFAEGKPMPFDGKRMILGSFESALELRG